MQQLRLLTTRLCVIVMLVVGCGILAQSVNAQSCTTGSCGCQVIECPKDCRDVGGVEVCYADGWCTGNCGGVDNGGCPPNTHYTPSGECRQNETGSDCPCGMNTQGTACKSCTSCWISKVDCPSGYTKDTTSVRYQQCRTNAFNENACGPNGTAQTSGGPTSEGTMCCSGSWEQGDNCTTNANGKEICDSYWLCRNWRIITYNCKVICNSTAPSNVSVTQGASATSANLSWTSGTNGLSQVVQVGSDLAKVNAGCVNPGDCHVNATINGFVGNTTYTYPTITGLSPSTTYYFRVLRNGLVLDYT